MTTKMSQVVSAAREGFQQLDAQLLQQEEAHFRRVYSQSASDNGNIAHEFALDRAFRLIFVRCHFVGGSGTNSFVIRVRSRLGSDFDTVLSTTAGRGVNADLHVQVDRDFSSEPSPWTMQFEDAIRCEWTNPAAGTMKWGLEVGLAMAT